MIFEWHDDKFQQVLSGRGITFEEVCSVFFDTFSVTYDDMGDYDENRQVTIGISNQGRILTVAWVERGNTSRIITAFEATKNQVKKYENARARG